MGTDRDWLVSEKGRLRPRKEGVWSGTWGQRMRPLEDSLGNCIGREWGSQLEWAVREDVAFWRRTGSK